MTCLGEGLGNPLDPQTQVRRYGAYRAVTEAITVAQMTIEAFLLRLMDRMCTST